ncbi:hypothetical protein GPALN_015002 [Globodera pallida]|nr:hypothetical protein GPALN_015002 [Globodera pallida]
MVVIKNALKEVGLSEAMGDEIHKNRNSLLSNGDVSIKQGCSNTMSYEQLRFNCEQQEGGHFAVLKRSLEGGGVTREDGASGADPMRKHHTSSTSMIILQMITILILLALSLYLILSGKGRTYILGGPSAPTTEHRRRRPRTIAQLLPTPTAPFMPINIPFSASP